MMKSNPLLPFLTAFCLILNACASAHLQDETVFTPEVKSAAQGKDILMIEVTQTVLPQSMPQSPKATLSQKEKDTQKLIALLEQTQENLRQALLKKFKAKGIYAVSLDHSALPPALPPYLKNRTKHLLKVNIGLLKQGNSPLRVLVGWGFGKSKLQTQVTLEEENTQQPHHPCLAFDISADSGWVPGAFGLGLSHHMLLTLIGIGASFGIDLYTMPDINHTANKISAEVEHYYLDQHWISLQNSKKSKKS